MRTLIKAILPLCLLLTFAGVAAAKTPDGVPPSQETVCDGQTGAAYGLCTAFCEAMDCDSPAKQASQTACDKVAAKFLRITGQNPPCAVVCPCIEAVPGFLDAVSSPIVDCTDQGDFVFLSTSDGRFPDSQNDQGETNCGLLGVNQHFITPGEVVACSNFLRARAAAAGVTCHP